MRGVIDDASVPITILAGLEMSHKAKHPSLSASSGVGNWGLSGKNMSICKLTAWYAPGRHSPDTVGPTGGLQ